MKSLKQVKPPIFQIFIPCILLVLSSHVHAEYDDEADFKDKVIGQVGQIKLKREHCNQQNYSCDYVVYDAKGKKNTLIKQWSKTAVVYQFSPKVMGFMIGATGNDHNLTVINDQNQQKDYGSFLSINARKTCFVTYERDIKNMPDSLVFYSIPDFKVRLVLNKKVPQFKKFNALSNANFEDNGDFRFEYTYPIENELGIQNVIVQNPCTANYRIVMD